MPFRARISVSRRASERLLVSPVHAPLSVYAIENPLLSGTRIRRSSGKASKSDNFCPREFTRRPGAPSKKNRSEENKRAALSDIYAQD